MQTEVTEYFPTLEIEKVVAKIKRSYEEGGEYAILPETINRMISEIVFKFKKDNTSVAQSLLTFAAKEIDGSMIYKINSIDFNNQTINLTSLELQNVTKALDEVELFDYKTIHLMAYVEKLRQYNPVCPGFNSIYNYLEGITVKPINPLITKGLGEKD